MNNLNKEVKSKQIHLRVSPYENKLFKAVAKAKGTSIADMVRAYVENEAADLELTVI